MSWSGCYPWEWGQEGEKDFPLLVALCLYNRGSRCPAGWEPPLLPSLSLLDPRLYNILHQPPGKGTPAKIMLWHIYCATWKKWSTLGISYCIVLSHWLWERKLCFWWLMASKHALAFCRDKLVAFHAMCIPVGSEVMSQAAVGTKIM